jgi:CBS domain-containing protein
MSLNAPAKAGDICTRAVVITHPGASLCEAARLMRDRRVGCLVVVEEKPRREPVVVGMITDRDITIGVVAADRDASCMHVSDLMSRDVITAREQDSLLDLLAAMRRKAVRRIPVTQARGNLVGVVALDDVLEVLSQEMQSVARAVGAASRHEEAALP